MVHTSLNIFDLVVLLVIGLSALLSFFRGFSREVLSLGSWVGAGIITLYAFPAVSHWLEPQVKNPMVASGLASLGVFVIALVLISIFAGVLLKFVKTGSEVGLLDNMVGLIFGAARGVLLVAIGYFIMTLVVAEKDYPAWMKDSVTRPYVARAALWVEKLTPNYLDTKSIKDDTNAGHAPKITHAIDNSANTSDDVKKDIDAELPSFEDLQKRIREENEKK